MSDGEANQHILFEAAAWAAKLSDSIPSETELAAFKQWLSADMRHARAMDLIERQWRLAGQVVPEPAPAPRRQGAGKRGGMAALAGLGIAVIAFLFLLPALTHVDRYRSERGETHAVTLSDGSVIRLNTDSAVEVRYTPLSRHVRLDHGEAEFTVSHSGWRPFQVDAQRARITVTGTHFVVRDVGGPVSTYLISGSVELRDHETGDIRATLRPGNLALMSPSGAVTVQASDGLKEKAWLTGTLVFDQTTLADALAEFARYAPVAVTLAGDDLRALKISGLYHSGDFGGFLDSLTTVYPLSLQTQPDGSVLLSRRMADPPGKK